MKCLFVFLVPVLIFYSCKDKIEGGPSNSDTEKSFNYFPLVKGSYIIYTVDSIIHEYADDNTGTPDSLITYYHFEIKEMIDSSFIDGEGEVAWIISRYRRDADSLNWSFMNVWTAKRNEISAQRVEDNVRYVKLSFPIRKNRSWNGNSYNIFQEEEYSYISINEPISIGGFIFDSSVTVLQLQEANALHTILKREKYVSSIGMVYKEIDSVNVNGLQQITNGLEYRLVLKDYYPK